MTTTTEMAERIVALQDSFAAPETWQRRGTPLTELALTKKAWSELPAEARRRVEIEVVLIRFERLVSKLERLVESLERKLC